MAVQQAGYALRYASEALKSNKSVVQKAVEQYGFSLQHAAEDLQDDKELVQKAITYSGYTLQYASLRLRSDPGLVVKAVANKPRALRYASQYLKAWGLLEYARIRLREQRNFVYLILGAATFETEGGCHLRRLGGFTDTVLREVALFAGVVRGLDLRDVQAVVSELNTTRRL